MLKIAICDDEMIYIDEIKNLVQNILKSDFTFSIDGFSSGEELFDNISSGNSYDIAFLDISMDKMSGIDVGINLRNNLKNTKMILIYISSYDTRAKEVLYFNAHRFLSKPIERPLFEEALLSACRLWSEQQAKIYSFKDCSLGFINLAINDILYFKVGDNHRVNIVTHKQTYTTYEKLSKIHSTLVNSDFLTIHHSFLINYDHISSIEADFVIMADNESLPISGPKRKYFRDQYFQIRTRREQYIW